jgi:hypothetical protein
MPVKITNTSDTRSNYHIEIAADRPDGSRITTGTAYAFDLEPGQTTEQRADFYHPTGCRKTPCSSYLRSSAPLHNARDAARSATPRGCRPETPWVAARVSGSCIDRNARVSVTQTGTSA